MDNTNKNFNNLILQLEAIIFLSGDGASLQDLRLFFKISNDELERAFVFIQDKYSALGINLFLSDGEVYFTTNPQVGEVVHNYFKRESAPKKLSPASLETLSIIAYKEPITKSELAAIRGVSSVDAIISNLEGKKLIKILGRSDTPGRPNLYGVTKGFYSYLNISKKEELPKYDEYKDFILSSGEDL